MLYNTLNFIIMNILTTLLAAADSLSKSKDSLLAGGLVPEKIMTKLSAFDGKEISTSLIETLTKWGLKLISAVLIFLIGRWIIRKLKSFLVKVLAKKEYDAALSNFLVSIVNAVLITLLIIIIIGILGIPTTSLSALVAAFGIAIGMALSGALQNFAGGVMILMFRPFRTKDYIEANGFAGTVIKVNITTTTLLTPDNKEIIIPNGSLINGNIINYSSTGTRRITWDISIAYGDDVEQAKKVLDKLFAGDKRIIHTPEKPYAVLSSLSDSAIIISARAWTKSSDYWPLLFDMNERIYKEFPKNNLNFPFPQMDVTISNPSELNK